GRIIEARHSVRMGDANPVFSADRSSISGIVELAHNGIAREGRLILLQGLHIDEANAAVAKSMIVAVAVSFLNDYLILETTHVGRYGMSRRRSVCHTHACCRSQSYPGGRT